jgi:hypothetical protein
MGVLGRLTGRTEDRLREELGNERRQSSWLEENLASLEDEVRGDTDWRRMTMSMDREFTRQGLDDLMRVSRAMYMSNPLIQRAVNVTTFYTWGQGVTYDCQNEAVMEQVVEPIMHDEYNRLDYFGHQARILSDVDQMVDGNLFQALFVQPDGTVKVRSIPSEEIIDIYTNEEDRAYMHYYHRRWTVRYLDEQGHVKTRTEEALYPDIRWQPLAQMDSVGQLEVKWGSPIIHQRTGGLKHMRFGVPELYSALDWARAYKKFLENWHTIVASLARFAWSLSTKGSKVSRSARRLNTTLAEGDTTTEGNRPPAAGSVFVGGPEDMMTPISKSGATTSAEDARPSRLMVASAANIPDTILAGDPDMGNLATAKTLDRPTELGFKNRQSMYTEHDQALFRFSIDQQIRLGRLPGTIENLPDGNTYVEPADDVDVAVNFPPILEQDMESVVKALVSAATLDGKTRADTIPSEELSRLLMETLGVDEIDAKLEDLDSEVQDNLAQAVANLAQVVQPPGDPQAPPPGAPPPPGQQPPPEQPR